MTNDTAAGDTIADDSIADDTYIFYIFPVIVNALHMFKRMLSSMVI